MRCATVVLMLLLVACVPSTALAAQGRDAPGCVTQSATTLPPTVDIDPDVCIIVDLGVLSPGDVYAMNVVILNDAIDLLFFDENGIQPYELGQSYRASMAQPASTEDALGGYEFHWSVPPSIQAKRWYMVLDNTAHDGDAGEGDQGGVRSTVSASVSALQESFWTPFNDLVDVDAGTYSVLLEGDELRLDGGTTLVLSAWDLEFVGDVYLQTRSMHDRYTSGAVGIQYIDGGGLQTVDTPKSLTWQVPSSLEGEELLLVVDNTDVPLGGGNGTEYLRMTVRLELSPPLTPIINDDSGSLVSIGESITLDASASPNRLGQRGTFSWDFDAAIDANLDGNGTNDANGQGLEVTASWDSPGQKAVTATMTAPSGEVVSTTYTVTVEDTVAPTARIQATSGGTPVSDGWKADVGQPMVLTCASSTDDDQVASCEWLVDGVTSNQNTSLTLTSATVRTQEVTLIVSDPSGNEANTTATIRFVDATLPRFNTSLLADFPDNVASGDSASFLVQVSDEYDSGADLRIHWDLEPTVDSDGNGDTRDDPDRVGLNPSISFDRVGKNDIVVTVFDASNNSATYAFSVNVAAGQEDSVSYGPMLAMVGFILLLGGLSVLGYRFWQRRLALDLLTNRGLSVEEAQGQMMMVAQQRTIPLLAKAEVYAGLDMGEVSPREDQEAAAKKAEMEAIYGTSSAPQDDTAFAPRTVATAPLSQGSSQAAAEAAALLNESGFEMASPAAPAVDPLASLMTEFEDEEPAPASAPVVESEPNAVALPAQASAPAAQPATTGVALPASSEPAPTVPAVDIPATEPPQPPQATPPPAPAPTLVRHTCSACGALFEIDLPAGLSEAITTCPSCGEDQLIKNE